MSLEALLLESARACEGAAVALAHSLRAEATAPSAPSNAVDTFREAEAFAITVRAVMDEAAPLLPLLAPASRALGRAAGLVHAPTRVHNGLDAVALVLLALFDTAVPAILDVAGNHTRWLVSPLQASACFERMVTHHGQLRALYGIIHLAAKIVALADVSDTFFVDVSGRGAHPDLEPARWRAAIKMDHFYGRHFGFHYAPEMRSVLRVVNIARGSIHKSHAPDDAAASPLVKNMAMLGWGWVYSNMVLMNSLGFNIEGVSQIGADDTHTSMSIEELRKFMNLVEEPLVAGVSGLASVDVAVDSFFEIPAPGEEGGLEEPNSPVHSDQLRNVLLSVDEPVSVRLISAKNRPLQLPTAKRRRKGRADGLKSDAARKDATRPGRNGKSAEVGRNLQSGVPEAVRFADDGSHPHGNLARSSSSAATLTVTPQSRDPPEQVSPPQPSMAKANGKKSASTSDSPHPKRRSNLGDTLAGAAESSYLANTIRTELVRLQSNVSSLLGMEVPDPASCLILHFHGGGFVSQSSESHAVYMKEWVADVEDTVMLSIDYKLAPEHRFPIALHECLYTYLWCLQHATLLGTRADKVVFAGDSAGGNLAVATALLAHQLGLRMPDGICVAYPALYVKTAWSPSRLLSFFDPLLPLSVLELCVRSYLPEGKEDAGAECPLLSPVLAEKGALQALPPVTMVCGSLDPLLDDAVLFADRLRKAGRSGDVMRVYEAMPHGFLNMNQVNVTARCAMRFMAKKISEYLEVKLRRGSKAENPDAAVAAAAVFDG